MTNNKFRIAAPSHVSGLNGWTTRKQPLLSVVTITFENPTDLVDTLASVGNIRMPGLIEQIVIDGSLSNRCADVVSRFTWVDKYLHEDDAGRYDAMNKGIDLSSGKYIVFLNSGDTFYHGCDFSRLYGKLAAVDEPIIYYGDAVNWIKSKNRYFLRRCRVMLPGVSLKDTRFQLPSHQSTIFPAAFCSSRRYRSDLSVSADTEFMIEAFSKLPSIHTQEALACFSIGGRSNNPSSLMDVLTHWREQVDVLGISDKSVRLKMLAKRLLQFVTIKIIGCDNYYLISYTLKSRTFTELDSDQ